MINHPVKDVSVDTKNEFDNKIDEAFDPFQPLPANIPIKHDKDTLDAAFTPIAVDN